MATATSTQVETGKKKKNKKINKMSLEEIEQKLQEVQQTQGGLTSLYARHLLRRREVLLAQKKEKGKV